ncbi:MAG: penicillin-binding protein 2 [Candidatus Midichloriaceae bacterium]
MRDERNKYKIFTRRALVVGLTKGALISCLLGRFYYLQILKSNTYETLSNRNRLRVSLISPLRGDILDVNGKILANNTKIYSVIIKKKFKKNLKNIVEKINNVIIDQKISLSRILEKSKNISISQSIKLIENISLQNAILLDSDPDLEEIEIIEEYSRRYQLEGGAFHIIGYIGSVSMKDINADNLPKNYQFLTGKDGIEKQFNDVLQGKPGVKKFEVDARGNFTKKVDIIPPIVGKNINLSINKDVQKIIWNHIESYNGAILVSDLVKQKIIGMVSSPTVDPNIFIHGLSNAEWNEILQNKHHPLINKCISTQYHPGSVFKIVMFLSILKSGIDHKEKVFCPGYYKLGNRVYKCWNKYGHGNVDLDTAFAKSCNVYFFHQSLKVGINNISQIANLLGLGQKTNIDLPYEIDGVVPNINWKGSKYKQSWYLGDTINSSIGQGYLETTPIQLLQMVAKIATGKNFTPSVINDENYTENNELKINQRHLDMLRKSMLRVLYKSNVINYNEGGVDEEFKMAGKTGTSQVISTKHNTENDLYKDHSLFVGYAPYDSPRFAISTVIENGGWGSKTALPISRKILYDLKGL